MNEANGKVRAIERNSTTAYPEASVRPEVK
jgi:hypothetical protein